MAGQNGSRMVYLRLSALPEQRPTSEGVPVRSEASQKVLRIKWMMR